MDQEDTRGPWWGEGFFDEAAFDKMRGGGRRGKGPEALFGPFGTLGAFGPFGPFGSFKRSQQGKDATPFETAAAMARAAAERLAQEMRGAGPDKPGAGSPRDDGREQRAEEHEGDRRGDGPRFKRGERGFMGPRGRRFDRGDVKYVLLDLLREGPRHGYDMIKEMERRSGGHYTPSPGSVYPTLQMLEDQGLVASTTVDAKRTYRLTDAGYAFIEERAERADDARGRAWAGFGPGPGGPGAGRPFVAESIREQMGHDAGELAKQLRESFKAHAPDARQIDEIRNVIGETRKRIESILAEKRDESDKTDKPTTL